MSLSNVLHLEQGLSEHCGAAHHMLHEIFGISWMSLLVMTRGLSEATCRAFHCGFMPLQQLKEPMFFGSAAL
jgi:hypothetical protein